MQKAMQETQQAEALAARALEVEAQGARTPEAVTQRVATQQAAAVAMPEKPMVLRLVQMREPQVSSMDSTAISRSKINVL